MNHTPGPWIVRDMSDAFAEKYTVERVTDGLRSVICRLNDVEVCPEHGGTGSDANAEFIVRACNAHEELVATLKEMTTILSNIQNTMAGYLMPDSVLDQDDCINAILNISDHKETLSKQRSALQLLTTIEKGS